MKFSKLLGSALIVALGVIPLSGCGSAGDFFDIVGTQFAYEQLTDGEQEYVRFPEETLGELGYTPEQKREYTKARMLELKEMSGTERALLPTRAQKKANKESFEKVSYKVSEEMGKLDY